MLVQPIRKCILFIGTKDADGFHPKATAFVVSISDGDFGFRYLVTAEHCVASFLKNGWDFWVRSNTKTGGVREDRFGNPKWYSHPNNAQEATDVALLPIDFTADEEFMTVPLRRDRVVEGLVPMAGTAEVLAERSLDRCLSNRSSFYWGA